MRLKREYDFDDSELITYHEFTPDDFEHSKMELYIRNLSRMADFAQEIEDNNFWYINYGNAVSVYGKSEFWDLFYKTDKALYMYKVKDPMFNPDLGEISEYRDATEIDLNCLEVENTLNHYADFKAFFESLPMAKLPLAAIVQDQRCRITLMDLCKENFTTDDSLLVRYWNQLIRDLDDDQSKNTRRAEADSGPV